MKSTLISAVSASSLFLNDEISATTSIFGKCPKYNVVNPFHADDYLGTWYEIARSKGTSWFQSGVCDTAEYSKRKDGYLGIYNSD